MRKFWYRRILIMILTLTVSVGGSYFLLEAQKNKLEQEVSAGTSGELVIPGGMPIGIYLETDGVLVLGTEAIEGMDGETYEPAAHLVKEGDYIIGLNEKETRDKSELIAAVKSLNHDDVILKVMRNEQGLGTITYLTADSEFGALGHGIHDTDTGELLNISKGRLYATSIRDVQRGESGAPGGMEGIIVYNNYNVLGSITKNSEEGIYGRLDRVDTLFKNAEPVEAASSEEIKEGKAIIRCSVEGQVEEYEVEITGINPNAREINKTIELEVTDSRLLELTGGIVQGMSGSPILQDGKLVGAVTHVFVNDPAKGYGILIEEMMKD